MTIEPRRGDVKVYWERQAREGSIATSANYGERFGMEGTASNTFYMRCRLPPQRGSFKLFRSETALCNTMFALCWADRRPESIISNRGTTLPRSDAVRRRHRLSSDGTRTEVYEKRIQRPPR
ncbi:TPA: hypothetical protein N0F65_003980 [Lagenidium giganteum]|uniref:Uncharacterized protein n=1 Tax=Lagenidium giganteum TaxID=4803 RepID=A0AAV2YZN0_9STRA|nr:TPA: hypothetical protein N0F65_003980 [Lagenidium giganteum]